MTGARSALAPFNWLAADLLHATGKPGILQTRCIWSSHIFSEYSVSFSRSSDLTSEDQRYVSFSTKSSFTVLPIQVWDTTSQKCIVLRNIIHFLLFASVNSGFKVFILMLVDYPVFMVALYLSKFDFSEYIELFQGWAKGSLQKCSLRSAGNSLIGPKWKSLKVTWLLPSGLQHFGTMSHFEATCLRSSCKRTQRHKSPPKADSHCHLSFLESHFGMNFFPTTYYIFGLFHLWHQFRDFFHQTRYKDGLFSVIVHVFMSFCRNVTFTQSSDHLFSALWCCGEIVNLDNRFYNHNCNRWNIFLFL